MRRPFTRREFLAATAKLGAAGAIGVGLAGCESDGGPARAGAKTPPGTTARIQPVLSSGERRTLDAALSRMIPAEAPGDWSAADVGAGDYIEQLLSGSERVYAGGPFRNPLPGISDTQFSDFQTLPRSKRIGWDAEIERLRGVYREGIAELDRRAGGEFAALPAELQDVILTTLDLEGSPFFAALYHHTMEGVYGHPVYGGNKNFRAWDELCYQGDVHGVRFPAGPDPDAADRPWDRFGGYAPEEMVEPGKCPGPQGPVK